MLPKRYFFGYSSKLLLLSTIVLSPSPTVVLSNGLWKQRLTLLTRLVFTDLCGSVQRLDRVGHWNGLVQWITILTTLGWCLASVGASSHSSAANVSISPSNLATNQVIPIMRNPSKLLSRALQMGLRVS